MLQSWKKECNDKKNAGKIQTFLRSTQSNSTTGDSGATALPPFGNSFTKIETSLNNHCHYRVFVCWERTDVIQTTNITFYYNRFSILTNDLLKSIGRFRIQLLLKDNTWSAQYTIPTNSQYSDTLTGWSLLDLNFTMETYGFKIISDQIDTPHADMCFSKIT